MDLWYDRRNPPSEDPKEIEFAAWCSRLLNRCAEELASPEPPEPHPEPVDLELVTGTTCDALVRRCMYFARSDFLPLKMRKQALSLLQAFVLLGDSKHLAVALGNNSVIKDSLAVLRLTDTAKALLPDKMVSIWSYIFNNWELLGSDVMLKQSREAIDANMLAYLEEWISTCQTALRRKRSRLD